MPCECMCAIAPTTPSRSVALPAQHVTAAAACKSASSAMTCHADEDALATGSTGGSAACGASAGLLTCDGTYACASVPRVWAHAFGWRRQHAPTHGIIMGYSARARVGRRLINPKYAKSGRYELDASTVR